MSNNDARPFDGYGQFASSMTQTWNDAVRPGVSLFHVDTTIPLFDVYLESLPEEGRQHYNCNTCRHFLNHYGNLAVIENGKIKSALWNFTPPAFFEMAVSNMKLLVESSPIVKVFHSYESTLGNPFVGGWDHLAVHLRSALCDRPGDIKTPNQKMAQSIEDYKALKGALMSYSSTTANKAVELLSMGGMYRAETVLPVAQAFAQLRENMSDTNLWLAVATNPSLAHVKSSMTGALMDDIQAGLSVDAVKSRFEERMNPGNYQRAQVAPTQGNVETAERIVERMGIAPSLRRRYARFDEVPFTLWRGQEKQAPQGGVFAGIAVKQDAEPAVTGVAPERTMTWAKFARDVLPLARSIEVKVDNPSKFVALVTAVDSTAPNITKWDNAFTWYYHGGADADIRQRVESAGGRWAGNEIRCSLAWDGPTDLDLHLYGSQGHIYFGNKAGVLDVDANGGLITSLTPVENMRLITAPEGKYEFYVDNYTERGNGRTPFKVELEVNGKVYTRSGVAGDTNWSELAFSFDYKKGNGLPLEQYATSSSSWGVTPNSWVKVRGITTSPDAWGNDKPGHTFLILEGVHDTSQGKGRGFFNEMLRSDLREIRKTLEAYVAQTPIEGAESADACGVGYSPDGEWNLTLRVVTKSGTRQNVKIDRCE